MFEGAYPPGVLDWMLDGIERVDYPKSCDTCMFYEERACGQICSMLEVEYTGEQLDSMTDEEYMAKFGKKPCDCCDEYKRWED